MLNRVTHSPAGNYRFTDDAVVFLDVGCVKRLLRMP